MSSREGLQNTSLDPSMDLCITFGSESDSLLAHLLTQKGFSRRHFDLLMEVLLKPGFKLEDLTLTCSSDVENAISEFRQNLVAERSFLPYVTGSVSYAGIPPVVLDLVIDYMIDQEDHFLQETNISSNQTDCENHTHFKKYKELLNLSLVHRSWTVPIQRVFYRRIVLTNRHSLQKFSRSPACTTRTGVREFIYKIKKSETSTFFRGGSAATYEHWSTLASVLCRLQNLRFLCLSIEAEYGSELEGFELVLEAISKLKNLEGLWLQTSRVHNPYFSELCFALTGLENLKYLSLCNWKIRESCSLPPYKLAPSSTLKSLQIRDVYFIASPEYLSWLFQPRGSYQLESLELNITFSRQASIDAVNDLDSTDSDTSVNPSQYLFSSLYTLLPCLSFFSVSLFYLDTSSNGGLISVVHDLDIKKLLDLATSLRRVRLHRLPSLPSSRMIPYSTESVYDSKIGTYSLPPCIEEIQVNFLHEAVNWRVQDQRLYALLHAHANSCFNSKNNNNNNNKGSDRDERMVSGNMNLKRIVVSVERKFGSGGLPYSHLLPPSSTPQGKLEPLGLISLLPITYKLCVSMDVELVSCVAKVDMNRHILDIIH